MMIRAPWSDELIAALDDYQRDRRFHSYTGERKANGDETVLIATRDGWVEREGGPVVQDWCHDWHLTAQHAAQHKSTK